MFIKVLVSCWLLAAVQAAALAEEAKNGQDQAMTNEQLTKAIQELQTQVAAVTGNLSDVAAQVGDLKRDQKALTDQINEEIAKQRQILDAISKMDSLGRPIPRLSAIMDASADFREDVSRAVHKSLKTEGDFSVINKTASYQRLFINQKEHGISAGETLSLKLPVGTVTTRLPGEKITNWTIGAPEYQEAIEIAPATSPATIVSPPIYVNSPPVTYFYTPWPTEYSVWPF